MKDIGKSVKNRLNNIAKKTKRQHSDLLQYYAMERFLYRLSISQHRDRFLLKGALLLQSIDNTLTRSTKDIDFIATSLTSEQQIKYILTDCINVTDPNDGITFDSNSIVISEIQRDTRYCGHRVSIQGRIDTAKINIQLDIGFGSAVIPGPIEITYPQLLDFAPPKILGSSLECAIADKFEAMVSRDDTNTRLKDFYDIWIITKNRSFSFENICQAVEETFKYYQTDLPILLPICLSEQFYQNTQTINRWNVFLKRSRIDQVLELPAAIEQIESFMMPVCNFINNREQKYDTWNNQQRWYKAK